MNTELNDTEKYLYVINGVIPEAMPSLAYRRTGRPELAGRKIIKCPYCREKLTDVERDTRVQLFCLPKGKRKKPIPGEFFKTCEFCRGEVGIIMK